MRPSPYRSIRQEWIVPAAGVEYEVDRSGVGGAGDLGERIAIPGERGGALFDRIVAGKQVDPAVDLDAVPGRVDQRRFGIG